MNKLSSWVLKTGEKLSGLHETISDIMMLSSYKQSNHYMSHQQKVKEMEIMFRDSKKTRLTYTRITLKAGAKYWQNANIRKE